MITPMPENAGGTHRRNDVTLEIRGLGLARGDFYMDGRDELGPSFCQCFKFETDYLLEPLPLPVERKRKASK